MTRKSFLTFIGAVAWGLFIIALIVSALIAAYGEIVKWVM